MAKAKKSTKPSRRTRAKKDPATPKPTSEQPRKAVASPAATPVPKAEQIAAIAPSDQAATNVMPVGLAAQFKNRTIGIVALGVIVIVAFFVIIGMQSRSSNLSEQTKSGGNSAEADKLLESGGNICTNGSTVTNNNGSADPQSVGMSLQNVPSNAIQTPEGISTSNSDLNTLQAASCY